MLWIKGKYQVVTARAETDVLLRRDGEAGGEKQVIKSAVMKCSDR